MNTKKSSGFSLIEMMLAITILMAASVGVYFLMNRASVNAAVEKEQRQLDILIEGIQGQFMANPDFSGVSTEFVIDSQLQGLRVANGELNSGFNTPMFVRAATTEESNDSFDVVYQGLSTEQCLKLIPALYPKSHNILVGAGDNPTTSVQETVGSGTGRLMGEDVLLSACSQAVFDTNNGTVVFRIFSPRNAGAVVVPPTSCLCEPTTEEQTIGCPAGQTGSIRQTRNGTCNGGTPTCPDRSWDPWVTTSNTCITPPTTPPPQPPVTPPANVCTPYTVNRTGACPAGQTGQIVFQDNYVCTPPATTPALGTSTQVSNTCAPPPPVVTTCTPSTETRYTACPAGQGGQIIEERSSSCPTSTSAPVWGGWVETSRTCTATCITAGNCCAPGRQTRTTSDPCPAGTYGGPQSDTEEQVSTCASATATPVWTGSWYSIGPTSGTCTACPAATNETQTRWVPNSGTCPAGQTGSITWEEEQVSTRTVSYSCPAGTTTLPGASYSAWGAWSNTGAQRNLTNTCVAGRMGHAWRPIDEATMYGMFFYNGIATPGLSHPLTPSRVHPAIFSGAASAAVIAEVRAAEARPMTPWMVSPFSTIYRYRTTSTTGATPTVVGGQNHDGTPSCTSANAGEVIMIQEAAACSTNLMGACMDDTWNVSQRYMRCELFQMPERTGGWLIKDTAEYFEPSTNLGAFCNDTNNARIQITSSIFNQTYTGINTMTPFDLTTGAGMAPMDGIIMGTDPDSRYPTPRPLECNDSRIGMEVTVSRRCLSNDIMQSNNRETTYVCNGNLAAGGGNYYAYQYGSSTTTPATCNGPTSYARVEINHPQGSMNEQSGQLLADTDYPVSSFFSRGFWFNEALPGVTSGRVDPNTFITAAEAARPNLACNDVSDVGATRVTHVCNNNTLTSTSFTCQVGDIKPASARGTYTDPQPGFIP